MNPVRGMAWAVGPVVLIPTATVASRLPESTYAGAQWWLLMLEVAAAMSVMGVVSARPGSRASWTLLTVVGAGWMVPELAGWSGAAGLVRTLADGWARLLPAFVLVALLPGARRRDRVVALLAFTGGTMAGGARIFLDDPFLDVRCWRWCDHNPLLAAQQPELGHDLEVAGFALIAASMCLWFAVRLRDQEAASAEARARVIAETALTSGLTILAGLRLTVMESAQSPVYVSFFVLTQVGAVGLLAVTIRERYLRWRLAYRMRELARRLEAATVPGSLASVLQQALADPGLELGYWSETSELYVDIEGVPVTLTASDGQQVTRVRRQGQPVAIVLHASAVDGDRLDRALGATLRLILENEQLRAAALAELKELRRSRVRVVERADTERRQLERNLHDGAQQRLVSLALLVRLMASRVRDHTGCELVVKAESLTSAAVKELRRVARGIHPAVLTDWGVAGAITELAASSTDIAVTVDGVPPYRYTGTVESTAYLVVSAALADARARGARRLEIRGSGDHDALRLDLTDEAMLGATHQATQYQDRVGALNGHLLVHAGHEGTVVTVELPCGS